MRYIFLLLMFSTAAFSQAPPIGPGVSHDLAIWRAARYSDVRYKLNLTLEKMSPVLKGHMEIRVNVAELPGERDVVVGQAYLPIVLDWRKIKGSESLSTVSNVSINGVTLTQLPYSDSILDEGVPTCEYRSEHLIFLDGVRPGENVIKLDFTSPILTSGSAITRYVDKEDGAEYIYSLFVPSDASTAFPVFDQPDLKARFTVSATAPGDWEFVSNVTSQPWKDKDITYFSAPRPPYGDGTGHIAPEFQKNRFFGKETKPISTYVFAFAAGPWVQVSVPGTVVTGPAASTQDEGSSSTQTRTPAGSTRPVTSVPGTDNDTGLPLSIYIRKSQAAKFKPHAAEVFRLTREGIKCLETYFDYKFPFPKYDLVLIPEFPFGGMEHAGATFLRESSIIFPTEPTKGDYISRANLIFHETAHQWFGDTVTMKWFDDLWLKEGFAEFMAYKTLEHVMPEANAWKVFYERNKQAAYATDSTRGTTPIYQPIDNLNSAKSAYGNIVYRKAPSFLRQAEFYLGEDKYDPKALAFVTDDKFQIAIRSFLKKNAFGNADWQDLVRELGAASGKNLDEWANNWIKVPGLTIFRFKRYARGEFAYLMSATPEDSLRQQIDRHVTTRGIAIMSDGSKIEPRVHTTLWGTKEKGIHLFTGGSGAASRLAELFYFANYGDYGYGIFLLDPKSREHVLKHIGEEKDPFLRSMMWGSLWDSVREGELDPREYVELAVRQLSSPPCLGGVSGLPGRGGSSVKSSSASPCSENRGSEQRTTTPSAEAAATPPKQGGEPEDAQARASARAIANRGATENDETIIQALLGRVSTAMSYYLSEPPALAGGKNAIASPTSGHTGQRGDRATSVPPTNAGGSDLRTRLEDVILDRIQHAETAGQRITFYRAFVNIASTEKARGVLKAMLRQVSEPPAVAGGLTRPSTGSGETSNVGANGVRAGASPPSGLQVSDLSTSAHGPSATQASPSELTTDSQEGRLAPALLDGGSTSADTPATVPLRTKDRFDIVTRLIILGDPEAPKLLADLEKTETSDDAKRYAYAAHAAFPSAENRAKFWSDFVNNKDISESWIEAAIGPFNSIRHDDLSLSYLQKALALLPTLKRDRKIFFVNGWLAAFIGGQRSQAALDIVNKFLADNPGLDKDLRLKILENVDVVERAVRIRRKGGGGAS